MKKNIIIIILIFSINQLLSQTYTISGYVQDIKTGEHLIGVNVYDKNLNISTCTNNFGFYSISFLANQEVKLKFSFVGYQSIDTLIEVKENLNKNIFLEQNNTLTNIEIIANKYDRIENRTEISTHQITINQLKTLPSLTGENDIMKAYLLMPGVQSGSEGATGLHVRGGSPDQNLILLDDIPLYYVNHIGGFFSVFDPDVIKNTKLLKGGFPARYGGRISSVFDIRMNDGNKKKYNKIISIGILSTKLLFEGPIKKNKTSFIFSIRRCNLDILTRYADMLQNDNIVSGYTFYDIYTKINHKFSEKKQLFFSFYNGNDYVFYNETLAYNDIEYKNKDNINWGNLLISIKLNHKHNKKLYSNFTIAYTQFSYRTKSSSINKNIIDNKINYESLYSFSSGVNDIISKIDFDFYANNNNKVKFGASIIFHTFMPSITKTKYIINTPNNSSTTLKTDNIYSFENSAYFEDEIKIHKKISFNIGFHFSSYHLKTNSYFSVQPRFISNIKLNKTSSFKTSYSYMTQYVHLLSNTGAGLPTDLWVPSTKKIKPENSNLYSLAFVKSFSNNNIEFSFETFYKSFDNLIDYKEGAILFDATENWQNKVATDGVGKSYGAEFLLRKNKGSTTGWISYYISHSERQFEEINKGEPYLYKYDRTHDIAIVFIQKINKKISCSATWVYSTGNLTTLAKARYDLINFDYYNSNETGAIYSTDEVHVYNGRNNHRLPAYHKLDLGINFKKKKKRGLRVLSIGIYNVYNRKNPYYLFLKYENNTYKLYQQSLFPIIPSISYSFKF